MKVETKRRILLRLCAVDAFAVLFAVALTSIVARALGNTDGMPFVGRGAVITPILGSISWGVALLANEAFRADLAVAGTEYYERVIRSGFIASGFVAIIGFVFDIRAVRPFILIGYPIGLIVHVGLRWVVRQNIRRMMKSVDIVWRILVISGKGESSLVPSLKTSNMPKLEVVCFLQSPTLDVVLRVVENGKIDAVYASADSGLNADELRELGWAVERSGAALWMEPATSLMAPGRISFVPYGLVDLMSVRTAHLTAFQSLLKRTFDVIVGFVLLVLLTPVCLLTALAIAVFDGFPILYSQERVGRNGKTYRMYKFRTMVGEPTFESLRLDTQRRNEPGTKLDSGQRITKTGGILRRWSIDEIPQLVHVLTGKMSLVGPRPRLPHEMIDLPATSRRLRARPGLTGLWQVSGRAELSFAEADALDVAYVDQWTFVGDIAIVIKTIKAVINRTGAL